MPMREPFARAAESADHFVSDQQHVVLAAYALNLAPVIRRRKDHAARSLKRLTDKRGHIFRTEFEDLRFQLPRAFQTERILA